MPSCTTIPIPEGIMDSHHWGPCMITLCQQDHQLRQWNSAARARYMANRPCQQEVCTQGWLMGAWDPRRQGEWTYGPQQPPGPFNSKAAGTAVCGGPEIGDACSNRGPKLIEELHCQQFSACSSEGDFQWSSPAGTACSPKLHGLNYLEGLGQYTALLMSGDADTHTHERAVAGRGRRV